MIKICIFINKEETIIKHVTDTKRTYFAGALVLLKGVIGLNRVGLCIYKQKSHSFIV